MTKKKSYKELTSVDFLRQCKTLAALVAQARASGTLFKL